MRSHDGELLLGSLEVGLCFSEMVRGRHGNLIWHQIANHRCQTYFDFDRVPRASSHIAKVATSWCPLGGSDSSSYRDITVTFYIRMWKCVLRELGADIQNIKQI